MPNKKLKKAAKEYRKRYMAACKEHRKELVELKCDLDSVISHDVQQFDILLNRLMHTLELDDDTLARILVLSPGTISRWRCGSSLPHPAMRRAVYKEFANRTSEELNKFILREKAVHGKEDDCPD